MIDQFYHKTCNEKVFIDLTGTYKLLTIFGVSIDGVTPGLGELVKVNTRDNISYYCPRCSTNLSPNDINGFCSLCGHDHYLADLFITNMGGVYCKDCCEHKGIKPIKDLNTIMNTILL